MSTSFSNNNIKHLSIKAGILYLSEDIYDEIRYYINRWLENISKKLSILDVKRLLEKHVLYVLPYNTTTNNNIIKCDHTNIDTYKTKKKYDKKSNTIYRYKTQYDNIKNDCLILTKSIFKQKFSDILKDYTENIIQFSEYSLNLLQMNLEYNIVELFILANKIKSNNTETLMKKDIRKAIDINNDYINNNVNVNYLSFNNNLNLNVYIKKLLKTMYYDHSITKDTLNNIDLYLKVLCYYIIDECKILSNFLNIKTLTPLLIYKATNIIINGELAKHAKSEIKKNIEKYNKFNNENSITKTSKAAKAELIFQPSRIRKIVEHFWDKRISDDAIVGLTSVIEYICAELLELSGNNARDLNKKTITVKHLYQVINYNDEELIYLTKKINFVFPGMKHFIENPYLGYMLNIKKIDM